MPLTPSLATADAGKVTKYSILHLLEWGGWQARTRDENFPRGGGAGRGVLSSVCLSVNIYPLLFKGKPSVFAPESTSFPSVASASGVFHANGSWGL